VHVVPRLTATHPGATTCSSRPVRSHTAHITKGSLQKEIISYWAPDIWPPCSPDQSPLDYSILRIFETRAQATSHANMESLKSTITREWRQASARGGDQHTLHVAASAWQMVTGTGPNYDLYTPFDQSRQPTCLSNSCLPPTRHVGGREQGVCGIMDHPVYKIFKILLLTDMMYTVVQIVVF